LSSIFSLALLQLPGMEAPDLTFQEQVAEIWEGGGFMMYFLATAFIIGMIVIIWKLIDLTAKSTRTRRVLRTVDGLVAEGRIAEAIEAAETSNGRRRATSSPRACAVTRRARSGSSRRSRTRA
jgi:hypothetical protein